MTDRLPTPFEVREYCNELALKRRALDRHKSASCAISVQSAKRIVSEAVARIRGSFKVLQGGRA